MKKYNGLSILFLGWLAIAGLLMVPATASAVTCPADNACVDSCSYNNSQTDSTLNTGQLIMDSVFATINSILTSIAQTFYENVTASSDFQKAVGAAILLYITIYGVMIMFNLASYHTGEVVSRLVKIAIVWAIIGPGGWNFFNKYVGTLFLGGMNDLITQFSAAGVGINTSNLNPTLQSSAMQALIGPLTEVFDRKFVIAIVSLLSTGITGWMMALFLIWGLIQFVLMVIGAVTTYVKSLVGLTFLFGVAPIFFAFILFEKTRQVFIGWLNQVVAFALTPVLLFAFLGFYCQLIENTVYNMLYAAGAPNFCYVTWFSLPGGLWDIQFWRPTINAAAHETHLGEWVDTKGNPLAPPFNMIDILYFLLLCHLGKSFGEFIEQIAKDLSGGSGPGVVRGTDVGGWFKNNLTGGRGVAGMGAMALGGAVSGGKQLLSGVFGNSGSVARAPLAGAAGAKAAGAASAGAPRVQAGTMGELNKTLSDANKDPAAFAKQQADQARKLREDPYLINLNAPPKVGSGEGAALDQLASQLGSNGLAKMSALYNKLSRLPTGMYANAYDDMDRQQATKEFEAMTGQPFDMDVLSNMAGRYQRANAGNIPGESLESNDLRDLLQAYKGMSNKSGATVDRDRQEITRNIEQLTGKKFNPDDYS